MKAIILAAGMSKRLSDICKDKPKSLFEIGGKSLLEYSLDALTKSGIKDIVIVIGYKGEMIKEKIGNKYNGAKIEYAENKDYMNTDTMQSLFITKKLIDKDILILEGDLLYEPFVIKKIIESNYKNLIVVSKVNNIETENLIYSDDKINIKKFGDDIKRKDILGEFVGISKLSKEFVNGLFDYFEKEHKSKKIYCERLFCEFAQKYKKQLKPLLIYDLVWSGLNNKKNLERLKNEIFPKIKFKKIKRIMLINPSVTILSNSLRRLTTPLGLIYIGGVLKKNGYEVKILDSFCEGYNNLKKEKGDYVSCGLSDDLIIKKIKEFNPHIIGIGNLFSSQEKNTLHYCQLAKKAKNVPVVIGGIHPTLAPEELIKNSFVDYIIIGEGEYRFLNLIKDLNEDKKDFDFDGIAYKKDGEIVINPRTSRIENLDEFGVPDRSLIDMKKYEDIGIFFSPFPRKRKVERILTTRGCPFNCVFCSCFSGKKLISRSVDNVMKEVDELVNKYKIEEIQFTDDNLTFDKERAMELFKRLEKYNLFWCTPNGIMVKTVDKEMIEAMAKSGAYQLTFYIESGSQRVLKEIINKEVPSKEKVKELVKICHNNGVQVHGGFIIGFPGETKEEIEATLQYPYEVDFDSVSFFIANPLPGSRLFEICKKKGYLRKNRKIDLKSSDIVIPKDDPNFVMSGEEMERHVDEATRKYNEFIKEKYPERWEKKFKIFNKIKHEKEIDIKGRVT